MIWYGDSMNAYRLTPRYIINGWIRKNMRAPSTAVLTAAKVAAEDPENIRLHKEAIDAIGVNSNKALEVSIKFHHSLGANLHV